MSIYKGKDLKPITIICNYPKVRFCVIPTCGILSKYDIHSIFLSQNGHLYAFVIFFLLTNDFALFPTERP